MAASGAQERYINGSCNLHLRPTVSDLISRCEGPVSITYSCCNILSPCWADGNSKGGWIVSIPALRCVDESGGIGELYCRVGMPMMLRV